MKLKTVWIILGISLFLVAARTLIAAQSALQVDMPQSSLKANRLQDTLVLDAARGDSLIKSVSSAVRNPFQPPAAARSTGIPAARKPAVETPPPAPVVPPRVILVMQDGSSTIVQIEVDGEQSPRMTVGSSYRGWTISNISPTSISVTDGSNSFNLRRP
jgi:hypothetical protein